MSECDDTGVGETPEVKMLKAFGGNDDVPLLDSGATHVCITDKDENESQWRDVSVNLAVGKVTARMNDYGEIASDSNIMPLGQLISKLGYEFVWTPSKAELIHPDGETIKVIVKNGTPHLSPEVFQLLLNRLRKLQKGRFVKKLKGVFDKIKAAAASSTEGAAPASERAVPSLVASASELDSEHPSSSGDITEVQNTSDSVPESLVVHYKSGHLKYHPECEFCVRANARTPVPHFEGSRRRKVCWCFVSGLKWASH